VLENMLGADRLLTVLVSAQGRVVDKIVERPRVGQP
jgi:hypothetical protein